MDKDLEKYLRLLNSDRCLKKPKQAIIIIDKITKCFTTETSQFTLGILISLLLDENEALITFIWKTSSSYETIPCVSAAFKLLEYLVTRFQKSTEPYFPTLYKKCTHLLSGKFAKVKELSLKLIKTIIETDTKQTLDLSKLVPTLEKQLREETKLGVTVIDGIYTLLGHLFEKHPECVKNEKWLLRKMLESLRKENKNPKNPSLAIVKSALDGINGYLVNYTPPEADTMKETYEYIKKWSKYGEGRKDVGRASLNILQTHWRHFSSFVYADREFWKMNMEVWMNEQSEDRQIAFKFLCSFYSVIALYTKQESNVSEAKEYAKEFINCLEFNRNPQDKKAALVGLKLFALAGCLPWAEFAETHNRLVNFAKKEETAKHHNCIPLSIECLSAFFLKFPNESSQTEQLNFLQRLSVKLIENYPSFEKRFQTNAAIALEKSFYMLDLTNLQMANAHIDRVLYQGLIRTCSTMTFSELELLIETGENPPDAVCCKSYASLWKYLLTLGSSPNLPVGGSFAVKKGVAAKVFDGFIASFLKIIEKLDFTIGPELELEKPSDLHIFINLVDLYRDLLPSVDAVYLEKWFFELFRRVIQLSNRNPLLSGFYQITEISMKIADRINFFDESGSEKCLELVGKFFENLLKKVNHYKGELQLSCLRVVLSAPVKLIEDLVEKTIPALEIITQLSRNCFPLLKDLIGTLERWYLHLPSTTSDKIMKKILPLLDIFFQSPYFRGRNSVDSSKVGKKLKVDVVFSDSELLELQKKFLMFLGNLEIRQGLNLIELPENNQKRKISDKHLVYLFPSVKGFMEVNLDEITLRVIDLAQSCGDRRTRIIACEVLYSLMMVIVGNVNQFSGGYSFLFGRTVKACLTLGCDTDGVVCQIFEPLMYQMVHYFSGKQTLHFSETEDLIEILMDSATCPHNPSVRDFSGDLLREFTVWSIKQLSPEELKTTPESAKRILERIYSLALHPSYNKRLGASVIFNRIYSVLREEDFILKRYWFELFYYFMESLRMCEESEEVTEIVDAIRHLERPLIERRKEFDRDCPERIVPPEFEGGRLCHLVRWTMERACDVKPIMRRVAMSVVQKLAPLVENCDSNMPFAVKQLQNFFSPKGNSFPSVADEEEYTNWLKYQCAGFEYCNWLLREEVLTTEEVFQSKFKDCLKRFINAVMTHGKSNVDGQEETILAFLTLLHTLKERVCLYPPEHWELLKMIMFRPTKFGFDVCQVSTSEKLLSVLVNLFSYFSSHLTNYDWNSFYQNLDTVMVAPVFSQITKYKNLTPECWEFLFALKVVEGSGMWKTFVKKIFFSLSEDLFLAPIFKSLFTDGENTVYAVSVEPSCRLYLEEVLKIMLKMSQDLKGVMKCLENEEEAKEEETGKTVKKGEFFLSLFKNTIFEDLGNKHVLLLEWVFKQKDVNLLIQVLENHTGNPDFPLEIFVRWQDFENSKIPKNELLHLAIAGARIVGTPGFLKTSPIASKTYEILESHNLENLDLTQIETIFSLFPFLSTFPEDLEENDRLRTCLSKIRIDLEESEDPFKQNRVRFALNGILESLKSTASLIVLEFLLNKTGWLSSFCKTEDVESALGVFGEVGTPVSHTLKALELVYHYCFKRETPDFASTVIYKLFLRPLMGSAPSSAVFELIQKNLEDLKEILTTYWKADKSSLEIQRDIARKTSAAGVYRTFILKLSNQELDQMPKEKRQMIDGTVKSVFFFLKKPYPPRVLKDSYRKLMCEIFNMICCVVSSRCVDEKFYKLFIFDNRGSFLFETIDKTVTYNLGMDFEEIPKRKKHLTTLREEVRPLPFGRDSIKYIQTNTLFTSSLQEEVTRFDLTSTFIRPLNSIPETRENVQIELEMDSLNSHECMATLVGTISKMVRDKITPVDDVTAPPCWLKFFLSILKNSNLSENLRLFVLKAVYNVQEFVTPYVGQIFPDLLDSILKLFVNYPVNYFLIDLIEMMVEWRHVPEKEKTQVQLSELVDVILEKSDSLRRDIVKYNMDVIKLMVEVWKNGMHLPHLSSSVFKRFSKSMEDVLDTSELFKHYDVLYMIVHTCGILLSNGIPAWKEGSEEKFFDLILKGFRDENKLKEVFGEICGQALNYLAETKPSVLETFEQSVRVKINSSPSCWMQLLYGVHKHYPKIGSSFTFQIFSSAWDSMDSLTVKKLEMLLSHVTGAEVAEGTSFDRHAPAFILDMLNSSDAEVQEYSLRIAVKFLHKFEEEKLKVVMKEVVRLQRSVHSGVRKWVYEIGKKLYRTAPEDVLTDCKIVLLRGLSDGVKELEDSCLEFWQEVLSSTSPEIALPQILKDMYASDAECIFLSNTVRMLVRLCEDGYNNKKELFAHPITRCVFRKRNLVLGSRQGFLLSLASTGRSLTNQSLENVATIRHRNLPYLRPTISTLKFQPTVQEEDVETSMVTVQEETRIPTNPLKRRFYKSEAKTSASFARWRNKNEKQQEVTTERKDAEVDILGVYRDGLYPDIQIRHSQITKPLEELSRRDPQTARLFLVSFYNGLIKTTEGEQRKTLLRTTKNHFENILNSSGNFDPGVFGFILEVMLHHAGELDIDYELVTNAAVSSNWISLGALIIEEIIANKEGEEENVTKKRRGCERPEEKKWLELARLYRSLEEFDVVSGIFLDKLNVSGNAKEAFRCESVWDWAEASKHYESVLRSNPELNQTEFYTESYLSCLSKLSSWSALNKCIRKTVNNDLGELWNNYYLLSWFLKSEMMISLGGDRTEFQTILEEFSKNSVKRDILSANFGEEMTVFDWFSDNLQRANHRIDKLCLDFLAGWSHLDHWSYNLRTAKLTSLQTLSELSFAVRTLSEVSKTQMEQNIQEGVKRWEKNVPAARDELSVWDVKLGYRREFLKHLKDFDLTTSDVKANIALAKAALTQENLNLTKECLSRVKEKIPEGNFDLKAEHHICFNAGKMVVAKLKMKDPKVGLEVYLNVWNGISKQISAAMETDAESKTLLYSCNLTLGQLIAEILPFVKNQTVPPTILKSLCQKLNSPEENISNALQEKGLCYFEAAINALENANYSPETKSNAYLELSKFLLKFSNSGHFEKLCKYLLKAMRLGNSDARELFGCLLNMSDNLSEKSSLENVISECELVPSWMFLTWINQMLSRLNSNLFDFLKPLLLRLTHDYPNAIRYPVKLMEEVKSQDARVKGYLNRLTGFLFLEKVYYDFWTAVRYLAPPDLILSHYLEEALEEANQRNPNYPQIKKLINDLQEMMFSNDYENFRGPVFKFWQSFQEPLNDLLIGIENQDVLRRKIKNVLSSIENVKMPSKRVLGLLESYSPWLYNFHALKTERGLELPGQYDGSREPIKKYLVTVSSFRNSVVMFDSKCRPMRICVLGNDAREHKFLVKFGEDLRQDDRIQQVFRHFSHRLTESKQTGKFSLDTYKVIPFTLNLGMIEWVDDTVSLYDMLHNSLGNDSDAIVKAQNSHLMFLSRGSPLAAPEAVAAHLIGFESIKRENAISNFKATAQMFPRDLLKKSFLDLSTSPQHFMHLRGNFATSHAITCVTHWLVGIGDRHLQNTLISTKTGRVLGIDFGYGFGFATQFLTPPELLPFRLSPQIQNVMHPLGESGWIKQTMIHCLRVYRKDSFRLRSVLEVFAEEPVLNWLKQVQKNPNYQAEDDSWHPREKLAIVERKLSGVNPVIAFEADLRAGHSKSRYLKKYLEVLKGVPQDNIRARCGEDGLTEEEQVECLIDLATDPHVLAKTYVGWNPWL